MGRKMIEWLVVVLAEKKRQRFYFRILFNRSERLFKYRPRIAVYLIFFFFFFTAHSTESEAKSLLTNNISNVRFKKGSNDIGFSLKGFSMNV